MIVVSLTIMIDESTKEYINMGSRIEATKHAVALLLLLHMVIGC